MSDKTYTDKDIEKAFRSGYKSGYREAEDYYNPDVGMGTTPSEDKAWENHKTRKAI